MQKLTPVDFPIKTELVLSESLDENVLGNFFSLNERKILEKSAVDGDPHRVELSWARSFL